MSVLLVAAAVRAPQGAAAGGPVLPYEYAGRCGESRDRHTGEPAAWDAADASHQHECIAWNARRLALSPPATGTVRTAGDPMSAFGRNDPGGQASCAFDFTGFRLRLLVEGRWPVTAVAIHPDSARADCRTEEIARYWATLATGERVVIGGDWNSESASELAIPADFRVNYSFDRHWTLATHPGEATAIYGVCPLCQGRWLDHAFSNFGDPCTTCGKFYDTADLAFGSALGGYDGHPRADGGSGMDHRQVLVDLLF